MSQDHRVFSRIKKRNTIFCDCSKPADYMLKVVNPTMNIQAIDVAQIPVIKETEKNDLIIRLVQSNIENSKCDWDSFETSWDFKKHPLI